ncbi:MAG TPA: hypothetical protein DCS23_03345 [Candidatus Yonathbacteria bacterium]|nr:hypothetical protein [Candidatus Yonathbacteria bacterium]
MEKIRKTLAQYSIAVAIYHLVKKMIRYPSFFNEYFIFKKLLEDDKRFTTNITDLFPCLLDNTATTGFEPHYVYHPAWACRVVKKINPTKHIDISSTVTFSTMMSAFIPVDFYDYRPAEIRFDNLECKRGDLMRLPFIDNSIESISCMHTVEHIGLGRYGDRLDSTGDIKASKELSRVVKSGGSLVFVVPVGKPKIEFNAHRIYSYEQVVSMFPDMDIKEFSLVPDDYKKYGLISNADKNMVKEQNWGCGCFWFIKK